MKLNDKSSQEISMVQKKGSENKKVGGKKWRRKLNDQKKEVEIKNEKQNWMISKIMINKVKWNKIK